MVVFEKQTKRPMKAEIKLRGGNNGGNDANDGGATTLRGSRPSPPCVFVINPHTK